MLETLFSNEFFNILTEILPIVHFSAVGLMHYCALDTTPEDAITLRRALVWDICGTVLQHLCSLFAHAGYRLSARLSHTVWYVDYSGILLVFLWNAPPMSFLCAPSLEHFWPLWLGFNLLVTVTLLVGSFRLTCTFNPLQTSTSARGSHDGSGATMDATFGSSRALIALFVASVGPSFLATFAAIFVCGFGRARLAAITPCLMLSLAIKTFNVPERWLSKHLDLSFSPLHSHCLWHCGVWTCEVLYLLIYEEALALRGVAV